MVRHTNEVVANILLESKFGRGGVSGSDANYAKVALGNNAGTPMQMPFGAIDMPMALVNRMFIKQIGKKMGSRIVFDNGSIMPEITLPQYFQDDRWLDALINGYTDGAVPIDTFTNAIHWENGDHKEDVFGVMPNKGVLTFDRGDNSENQPIPRQDTTLQYLNSATSAIEFSSDGGFATIQPLINKDVSFTLTGSGSGAIALKWSKAIVMIAAIASKKGTIGDGGEIKYPWALDYEIELDLTFFDYDAILLEPKVAIASMEDWDLVMDLDTLNVGGTHPIIKNILTINDLIVKESSVAKIPEMGVFEHNVKLMPGPNFLHTSDLLLASG